MSRPRATRLHVIDAPPAAYGTSDYADAFGITRRRDDRRDASHWARDALDRAPRAFRAIVPVLWHRLVGFRLGPRPSADHILGWRIVESSPEVIYLRTESWLMAAAIVVRVADAEVRMITYLQFRRPRPARPLWVVLGPIHRFLVPRLLRWASP